MKSSMIVYLLLLGVVIGLELAAGAFMAPVIFFPQPLLGEGVLSHFQSGLLMTEVFLRLEALLLLFTVMSFIYEFFVWIRRSRSKDTLAMLFVSMAFILVILFVYYYTPFIQEAQKQGEMATVTDAFKMMHKQSEWVMKALMMTQIGLFIRRAWLFSKD